VIVADASAIAELLVAQPRAAAVRRALSKHAEVHVPDHFHAEVLSVLRRRSLRRELSGFQEAEALAALDDLRAISYPVRELIVPIWDMRANLSVYDAAYLALAQRLDAGLITLDAGLAEAATRDGRLVSV
jgi:predicted nucleic acid-binding protein